MNEQAALTGSSPATTLVLTWPAEVDYVNAESIGAEIDSAFGSGASTVIVDLTATRFCDSTGLGKVARAHRLASTHGVRLRVVVPAGRLARLLSRTALDRVLTVDRTLHAALASEQVPEEGRRSTEDQPVPMATSRLPGSTCISPIPAVTPGFLLLRSPPWLPSQPGLQAGLIDLPPI